MEKFLEMLTFMRPAFNPYDDAFVARYIDVLEPNVDAYGNRWIDVGDEPTIVWSSHTDTVHDRGGFQQVVVDKKHVVRVAPKQRDSNCLGADCTTGVWLMLEMIEAGVPGRYIFHRNEENGGIGSKWIKDNTPELLRGIKAAIAFDRKGTNEIIIEQGAIPTASKEFAQSFAKLLGGSYRASPNGSYTDTKEYRALVPECTNLAVGYQGAHTSRETQDLKHLTWLRDVLCSLTAEQLDTLVIQRDPKTPDPVYYSRWDDDDFYGYCRPKNPTTVEDLCRQYPLTVSKILEAHGIDFEYLDNEICNHLGIKARYGTSNSSGVAPFKVLPSPSNQPINLKNAHTGRYAQTKVVSNVA